MAEGRFVCHLQTLGTGTFVWFPNKSTCPFHLIKMPLDNLKILVYYIIDTLRHYYYGGEKMNFDDNLPIYIQIMNLIKSDIVSGEISGGDKLPSVREYSKELKVNPNTVQRTYQELEREGLVFTQRGMGTFVTEDLDIIKSLKKDMASGIIHNFLEEMRGLGFNTEEIINILSEWIEKEGK